MTDRHMQEAQEIMARGRMNYGLDMQEVIAAALRAAEKRGREEEREQCEKAAMSLMMKFADKSLISHRDGNEEDGYRMCHAAVGASDCAYAIRARKDEP